MAAHDIVMAAAGASGAPANYIEDVFSTYLYTGNSSTQTITNGIDLSIKGGLVWIKARSQAYNNLLSDSANGPGLFLVSNSTAALSAVSAVTDFTSSGFQLPSYVLSNQSGTTFASWTFRKQPKFFDVQTGTTNGSSSYGSTTPSMSIAHNLGAVPGCVIVKRTDATGNFYTWHRGLASTLYYTSLNTTSASTVFGGNVNGTGGWIQATSTHIYLDAYFNTYEPGSYVVYIFAHNAGGFGLTGTDNVISCGSVTLNSSGAGTVNLGYEPQWVLMKLSSAADDWTIFDTTRGFSVVSGSGYKALYANTSGAEFSGSSTYFQLTNTGFSINMNFAGWQNENLIYIAIRRGPMKVPTSGTSVFDVDLAGNSSAPTMTSAFPVDLGFIFRRSGGDSWYWVDRLRGTPSLSSDTTAAEASFPTLGKFDYMNGYGSSTTLTSYTGWNFRRAPSFFDEVCYTGTGSARTVTHNLGAVPELMIVKNRSVTGAWNVYTATTGNTSFLELNTAYQQTTSTDAWNNTSPTSSVFTVGVSGATNGSGNNLVAYLFATCAGVSKVGSYTGTGATQTISCGFTGGARFVLIKRISVDGYGWYVWDTVRGMVAGTDPSVQFNTQNAEVNANSIYTTTGGFQIVSTAAGINASGGTYIFLAIA